MQFEIILFLKGGRHLFFHRKTILVLYAFWSADFFSNSTFSKNYFWNTTRVSNSLDPGQAQLFVRPDLGSDCLQRLSADNTSRQRLLTLCILETLKRVLWQTVKTQMKGSIMLHFIRVCIVC